MGNCNGSNLLGYFFIKEKALNNFTSKREVLILSKSEMNIQMNDKTIFTFELKSQSFGEKEKSSVLK